MERAIKTFSAQKPVPAFLGFVKITPASGSVPVKLQFAIGPDYQPEEGALTISRVASQTGPNRLVMSSQRVLL